MYVHDLRELEIRGVGGEQTSGGGIACSEADLRVNIEQALSSAWRPDDGHVVSLVVLKVVAGYRADEVVLGRGLFPELEWIVCIWKGTCLFGVTGEVVSRLQRTADAFLESRITTVVGAENRVLEAAGVGDGNVQLAVLALLGNGDVRADGRLSSLAPHRGEGMLNIPT